jgi:RHS repeat-associated protein
MEVVVTTTTDYIGGFHYEEDTLQFFAHEEGRVVRDGSGILMYQYNLADHLGNVRLTYEDADSSGTIAVSTEVAQSNDPYPFGMNMAGLTYPVGSPKNSYLYNGKELQDELGLNWYDYGNRFYDPVIGRFTTQDRFSEKYASMTPYQYGANNPILFIDVNGDSLYVKNNEDSHNDIKSLAKENNQQYISFNENGSVTLDFSKVDAKTKKKALRDQGLKLINKLVNAKKEDGQTEKYYYEASNQRRVITEENIVFYFDVEKNAGKETGRNDNSFVLNLSTTHHGEDVPHPRPLDHDGEVFISPGKMYDLNSEGKEYEVASSLSD